MTSGWAPARRPAPHAGFDVDIDTEIDIDAIFDAICDVSPGLRRLESDAYEITVLFGDEEAPRPAHGNPLFDELAEALEIVDDERRLRLVRAVREAGATPGTLNPDDLWFLAPCVEAILLEHAHDAAAAAQRARLAQVMRAYGYWAYGR